MTWLSKLKSKNKYQQINHSNIDALRRVVSQSGISWHELYYVNENHYFTCFQIMEFPDYSTYDFIKKINERDDCFAILDFRHVSAAEFESRSDAQFTKTSRKKEDARSMSEFTKASKGQSEYRNFSNYVDATKAAVKLITLRVFVFGKSFDELQRNSEQVTNELISAKLYGYIQTNNLIEDYQAITMVSNPIEQDVSSHTLADLTMNSNVNIVDHHAAILGDTGSGVYAPNQYSFNNNSYNVVYLGGMGSGKSALAKKVEKNLLIKGNHVTCIIDIHNEYDEFCFYMKIPRVSFSEKQNINVMQIFHVDNKDNDSVIRENDIQVRISSIQMMFEEFTRTTRYTTIIQLGKFLKARYEEFIGRDFTALEAKHWPVLGDVLEDVKKAIKELDESKGSTKDEVATDYYNLQTGLEELCHNYGYIFNQRTNIEFDLSKSVCFDISFLRDNKNEQVVSSYAMILLNYASYGVHLNLQKNLNMERVLNSKLSAQTHQEPYFTHRVLIDEFMKFGTNGAFLNETENLLKYMRKAYSGLAIIVHTTSETQNDLSEHGKSIKNIFDLCTNKFIGKTGEGSAQLLPDLLTEVTEYDALAVTKFKRGEKGERLFLAHDDQGRKIYFTSIITPREQSYFKGGV